MIRLAIFVTFLLSAAGLTSQSLSQSVVASSGGNGTGEGISIQWTIGETFTETLQGDALILTQGFHQTDLIVTSIDEISGVEVEILAFPNPATEHVTIGVHDDSYTGMTYRLADFLGNILAVGALDGFETQVSFSKLQSGVYFLVVSSSEQHLKTFRIVKK